ncbi:MAG: NADH:flavin oxidoreductase [Zavarzinella sp.]
MRERVRAHIAISWYNGSKVQLRVISVAKYFKYKSIDDLLAENARLGLDIAYSDDLAPLFQPVHVGQRVVGNRWCIHPMEGCDGELNGHPGELTFRRYNRFGGGGAKLIWGEACAVNMNARANPRQIVLNEDTKPSFRELVVQCRQAHRDNGGTTDDLLFGIQLTHSGRYSYPHPIIATHDPLLDPRTIADRTTGKVVDAQYPLISDSELSQLVDDYVQAAKLAREVGFDFVDVKQCHRYLLNELLGARNRPGRYGGSLENRTRLATEIFTAIRAAVPDILLATRMNAFDGIPFHKLPDQSGGPVSHTTPVVNGWGISENDPLEPDLTEVLQWIGTMQQLGVQLVNITLGNPYAQPHFGRPFEYPPPDGYDSPEHPLVGVSRHFSITAQIQERFPTLAVVGTGYSYLQEFMPMVGAANVQSGKVTFVGVGRASLAQPDWVKQILENGKLDRKRICRTFSYCTAMMRSKNHPLGQYPAGCPPFDKEAYHSLWQEILELGKRTDS